MSSSSSFSVPNFDVFLSFSTEDSTNTFVSDLYRSLSEKGIAINYKDDKLEKRFLSLGSDLKECIKDSALAVVVVSESYPTSVLCLNQLEAIVNLQDEGQLSVIPIFYGVDPSNIRKQTGEYIEAFRYLGEKYSPEKVQSWRSALTKLTNISGLDSRFWSKEKTKMVDLITSEILHMVSNKHKSPSTTKADGHVALDRHMQALYELLDLKSDKEVRLVGIWGPGGVGKTTLARYAYEELSTNFHVRMFVDNSENIYHQHHRETLTSRQIQEGTQKMTRIKSTIRHRKGLLVVDSVDNLAQLKDIAEIVGWCGAESRIILIAQDRNLLDEFGVKHVYEVQSLRYDEALQLFSQSAFKQQHPPTSFESLSLRAVQIASFLPLTLKILGSFLQGKDEKSWDEELRKLEGDQEKTILDVMKKNYTRENEEDEIPSFIFPLNDEQV